jgi:hypothetical protein
VNKTSHPLDGIREKLKRADKSIRNLESEIAPFLAKFPTFEFPVMTPGVDKAFTDEQRKAWDKFRFEFMERDRQETIPPIFAVLAGEIIHHLRSSFDHLAWQLSDETCRNTGNNRFSIEFPVFDADPAPDPKESGRYRRKVKCIINRPSALTRIQDLQPYKSIEPLNTLIWRIHDMDRTDKHRELTLVVFTPTARLEATGLQRFVTVYKAGIPIGEMPLPRVFDMKVNTKIAAHVAFGQSVKGEFEAIVPFLQQLHRFTMDAVESFAQEFR